MRHIIVDATARALLLGAVAETELRDEHGHRLGRFVPDFDRALYDIREIGLSPEELDRRRAPDAKTYTTADVLAHLRGLK